MDYYKRSQLPVLSFAEEPAALHMDVLRDAICEKPCNVVFVEVQGKLNGIISRGDISSSKKAGQDMVPVNKNYTFIAGRQFMKAREIFREKTRINEIPVIDEEGCLMGICSRNDDLLYLEYSNPWEENKYIRPFLEQTKKVRFVRAFEGDERRKKSSKNGWQNLKSAE